MENKVIYRSTITLKKDGKKLSNMLEFQRSLAQKSTFYHKGMAVIESSTHLSFNNMENNFLNKWEIMSVDDQHV